MKRTARLCKRAGFREPFTDSSKLSRADYQLLKTRGLSALIIAMFRSANHRPCPTDPTPTNSNRRILSLILIAEPESHDLTRREGRARWSDGSLCIVVDHQHTHTHTHTTRRESKERPRLFNYARHMRPYFPSTATDVIGSPLKSSTQSFFDTVFTDNISSAPDLPDNSFFLIDNDICWNLLVCSSGMSVLRVCF